MGFSNARRPSRPARFAALPVLASMGVLLCPPPIAGAPPTARLLVTPARLDTVFYQQPFAWMGTDPESGALTYRYAIDPPATGDPWWIDTSRTMQLFFFQARHLVEPMPSTGPARFAEPHTLMVEARDPDSLLSAPDSVTFFTYTYAPDVAITSPFPPRTRTFSGKGPTGTLPSSWADRLGTSTR